MTSRIRWEPNDDGRDYTAAYRGYAGTSGVANFVIYPPAEVLGRIREWVLRSDLPGQDHHFAEAPRREDLEPHAERWLEEFVTSLGAGFPPPPPPPPAPMPAPPDRWTALAAARVDRECGRLIAFLAACYGCTLSYSGDGDDDPVVFIETPAGQLWWRIAEADTDLFQQLGPCVTVAEAHWDGSSAEGKHERLEAMTGRLHHAGGLAGLIVSMAHPERTEPYPTAVERDELRAEISRLAAVVADLRSVLLEGGQPAEMARRRALAILAGTVGLETGT